MRTDLVRRVEPNHIVYLEQVPAPSDPYFTEQWGLDDVDAREAWTIAIGTSAVKVAIVDSGIESQHPDLVGRVDAARSYNFVDGNADSNDTSGLGHGTMVAGVIGAVTGNAVGIAGLNWNVTLLALKFAREGSGLAAHAAEAIDFAREQGADVINVSWSLEAPDGYLQEALENAANVLVVAAATTDEGGARDLDSFGEFPCVSALPNVLCVTASDSSGAVASSWGATTVDLAAPGVKIWSTFKSPHYRSQDGTSMAAPFVSGVAALIRSRCPYVDVAKLRSALLAGEPVLAQVGVRVASGMRLNARLALERAAELDSSCALRAPGRPVLIE